MNQKHILLSGAALARTVERFSKKEITSVEVLAALSDCCGEFKAIVTKERGCSYFSAIYENYVNEVEDARQNGETDAYIINLLLMAFYGACANEKIWGDLGVGT